MSFLFFILSIACSGCQPKNLPEPEPPPPDTGIEDTDSVAEEDTGTEDPVVEEQLVTNFQKVFFDLNSYDLNQESKDALDQNIEIMKKAEDVTITIEGHADERGTTEHNIALGQNRANSVLQYFRLNGIAPSRIKVISFGEEKPAQKGFSEEAWSKNRRCEFVITRSSNPEIKGTSD